MGNMVELIVLVHVILFMYEAPISICKIISQKSTFHGLTETGGWSGTDRR